MYQTLDDLENIQYIEIKPSKRKKLLKRILICLWILISLTWVRVWLTKAGVIPNWLDVELLCSWKHTIKNAGNYADCKKQEKIIKDDCIDCKCQDFANWSLLNPPISDDGQRCCEWTYYYHYISPDVDKPIIYLYPTVETEINVKLWTPENLSHTYPKYNSEKWWNVIAQPNWDLKDMETWRKLYALYREWKILDPQDFDEWFVVAWKDIIPFLEEKLAILWLNEREAEEFIVYWLPQMEGNEWNLIRFETKAEQDENMPLNITPKPDTVIRVMMDWKAIDEPIDIPEQQLFTPERTWFTVVEWWGSPRN